jgi:hypothetical protein
MTYAEERVAAEMGRALMAIYRAGWQVRLWPDALSGRAGARLMSASERARGASESPLQALYAAVEQLNERAGAVVVRLD